MKITFLGTGADTAYPLPFCHCEYCEYCRHHGGRNLRKRSSLLINEDLLIDLGPDVMSASFMHGVSIDKVRYLLQTHAHSDHFDGGHIQTRIPEYVVEGIEPLPIYASQGTLTKMSHQLRELGYVKDLFDVDELKRINCSIVSLTTSALVTAGAYNILPVSSNHDVGEESLVFAIRNEGNSIFYGTDTDELSSVSLTALVECGWKYDIVILDHTYGWDIDGGGHLNGNKFVAIMDFMNKNQLVNDDTRFFATHISHEGNPPHEAFNKIAAKYGYEAAYDGLQIEI